MPNYDKEKALIVVDMIKGFSKNGSLPVPGFENILPNIKARIDEYKAAGLKVIFLGDNHKPNDLEFVRFPKHCTIGTDEVQVVNELPFDAEVDKYIPKTRYSGFYGTNLDEYIKNYKTEVAEVCGVCTSICVLMTVAGLVNRDIATVVHRNCVSDLTPESHYFALGYMERILGTKIV